MIVKTRRNRSHKIPYADYLKTKHWWWLKRKLYQSGVTCMNCGKRATVQFHHISYDNLWHEGWRDIVPICRDCHKRLHEALAKLYPGTWLSAQAKRTREAWPEAFGVTFKDAVQEARWKERFHSVFPGGTQHKRANRPKKQVWNAAKQARRQLELDRVRWFGPNS